MLRACCLFAFVCVLVCVLYEFVCVVCVVCVIVCVLCVRRVCFLWLGCACVRMLVCL